MPGLLQVGASEAVAPPVPPPESHCSPLHQKVTIDINLCAQSLKGSTEILLEPHSAEFRLIKLNCRQARITRLSVGGRAAGSMTYIDPYKQATLPWVANVHQYHMLEDRIQDYSKDTPEAELTISLPKSLRVTETTAQSQQDSEIIVLESAQPSKLSAENARFSPVTVYIEFTIDDIRDGMHFAGWNEADLHYPHAYTSKLSSRSLCCLFPCFDTLDKRCTWELSFRTPKTVGDAFKQASEIDSLLETSERSHSLSHKTSNVLELSDEDRAMDIKVVCSGDITDEITDPNDPAKKTTSFLVDASVSAQHIGFAIGAFQTVKLTKFRESNEDDRLGKNAIPIYGFCLPKRSLELENTCFPLAKAMDHIVQVYGAYPYPNFKVCFVDGMPTERMESATLSIVSNALLFPEEHIDNIDHVTRELIYGLAYQWIGINIVPRELCDLWAVIGVAYYMADSFIRKLSGNNEYRFAYSKAVEQVVEMDIGRPSLADSGRYVAIDPSHLDFINRKAPLVLFILDRRLTKISGSTGVARIIAKILLNAKIGILPDGALSTQEFFRTCERIGHTKLDIFFNQWVLGAGCPRFRVTQRFNKKRLVVEMQIMQAQSELSSDGDLQSDTFMREVKESANDIWDTDIQSVFTGPMTIRIHEADGTPYEHIVEIREAITRFEIPYNTKYKRLKRTRRNREKISAGLAVDQGAEGTEEALLYCLGDVLQSADEESEWRLSNWSKEDEEKMSSESYEWIRMDADFEWICKLNINMPGYMYVSQLQQDRDVNAQYDTVQYLATQKPLPLVSSILARTLADQRYFHGIRSAAANALTNQAKDEAGFVGLHHLIKAFQSTSNMATSEPSSSNDFSDRAAYYVRKSIILAVASVRNNAGRSPIAARKFLYDLLRSNDNSNNDYSDHNYVALILEGLASAQASAPLADRDDFDDFGNGDDWRFQQDCIEEIERHRRIDEWIPSFHNVFSIAALDCKMMLTRSKAIPREPFEFLQYTQDGTYDDLRVSAFRNLMELGYFNEDYILKWFMFVLGHDPSPQVRLNLLQILGKWIGEVALGDDFQQSSNEDEEMARISNGLVIEQDSSTDIRKADIERRQTISGARAALQSILASRDMLKAVLWSALQSSLLTLREISDLLTICGLLYQPHTAMVIVLKYPRYYKIVNRGYVPAGNGLKKRHIISFIPTRARQKPLPPTPIPKLSLKLQAAPTPPRRTSTGKTVLKLKMNPSLSKENKPKQSVSPGRSSLTPSGAIFHEVDDDDRPKKLKLKLKLGGGPGGAK